MGSIHICFADDLLMYCRADIISFRLLNTEFMRFFKISGSQENADKSSLYIDGVVGHSKEAILEEKGYVEGNLPFRYLGVPLA